MAIITYRQFRPEGGSAIADMLKGVGQTTQAWGQSKLEQEQRQREEEDRQRQIEAENEAREIGRFNAMSQVAANTSGFETSELPVGTSTFDIDSEGGLKKKSEGVTTLTNTIKKDPMKATLFGQEHALPFAEDLQERDIAAQVEAGRRKAVAEKDLQKEFGEAVTLTPEMIQTLPEGALRDYWSTQEGKTVPTSLFGDVALQTWASSEQIKQQLDAEARENREWTRREQLRQAGRGGGSGLENLTDADIVAFNDSTATGWRDFDLTKLTRDNLSTRSGLTRGQGVMLANQNGRVLPDQKSANATLAAKSDLADLDQIESYLGDPEVTNWIGAYSGRMADFISEGWLDPLEGWLGDKPVVPQKVMDFRSALNRLAAGERHAIYGAAVTGTEVPFARSFIPAMNTGLPALLAATRETRDNLERGLDAMWGVSREEIPIEMRPSGSSTGSRSVTVNPRDPYGIGVK